MKKPKVKAKEIPVPALIWQRASYQFHTYAYRDPRAVFASAVGSAVVSPTTALLGIASTLFSIGDADTARKFLAIMHQCEVMVDAPDAIVFFRAFHQIRRYYEKYIGKEKNKGFHPKFGLTKINQGTREYGLVDGAMTLYVGVPEDFVDAVNIALTNLRHLGTHDSLCSLVLPIEKCPKPQTDEVLYCPNADLKQNVQTSILDLLAGGMTIVTLSRFIGPIKQKLGHWHLAGGTDTELLTYAIPGCFEGTTRGKIYRKNCDRR